MTTAVITGGMGFANVESIEVFLEAFKYHKDLTKIIISGASKAEKISAAWAKRNYIQVVTFDLDYSMPRKEAVADRNKLMLNRYVDFVVAFPGGDSTADMCAQADALGIQIYRVDR
jgi:hypothetical protein